MQTLSFDSCPSNLDSFSLVQIEAPGFWTDHHGLLVISWPEVKCRDKTEDWEALRVLFVFKQQKVFMYINKKKQ